MLGLTLDLDFGEQFCNQYGTKDSMLRVGVVGVMLNSMDMSVTTQSRVPALEFWVWFWLPVLDSCSHILYRIAVDGLSIVFLTNVWKACSLVVPGHTGGEPVPQLSLSNSQVEIK